MLPKGEAIPLFELAQDPEQSTFVAAGLPQLGRGRAADDEARYQTIAERNGGQTPGEEQGAPLHELAAVATGYRELPPAAYPPKLPVRSRRYRSSGPDRSDDHNHVIGEPDSTPPYSPDPRSDAQRAADLAVMRASDGYRLAQAVKRGVVLRNAERKNDGDPVAVAAELRRQDLARREGSVYGTD